MLSTFATGKRFFVLALDPGAGGALRDSARRLSVFIPAAGVALAILAALYLRSLLKPYDRLLAAAGDAPAPMRESGDEREFVVARFEATIAALREKERELERLARREKERADDLETARPDPRRSNLPTGLLSVDPDGRVVELNEAGREILKLDRDIHGEPYGRCSPMPPTSARSSSRSSCAGRWRARREVHWRRAPSGERVLGVTATPAEGADGRFLGAVALFSDSTEIRRARRRASRWRATSPTWARFRPGPPTSSATPPRRLTGSRTSRSASRTPSARPST